MSTVAKLTKKSKHDGYGSGPRGVAGLGLEDFDARVAVIQALIPVGLAAVSKELDKEVRQLAGERYQRAGRQPGHVRWAKQAGSVYLADQKVPIRYTRVRDLRTGREVGLKMYEKLQTSRDMDEGLLRRVLLGLSCGRYQEAVEAVPPAFGVSRSTVSRRFVNASTRKLKALMERRLDDLDLAAVIVDGKTFADDAMVIAVGVTLSGEKVFLGVVQTATENERALTEFFRTLVSRGLSPEVGILWVIDGSKGLRAAIRKVFGEHAPVQRCQWHKRENVVSYLPKHRQPQVRDLMRTAYRQPTYAAAKARLMQLHRELARENPSAAASLAEGLEETLTLHRLGVAEALGKSLSTTNVSESINAQLGHLTRNVTRWRNGAQKHRWVASALLAIEPRLRRIKGYRALPRLRAAILRERQRQDRTTQQAA